MADDKPLDENKLIAERRQKLDALRDTGSPFPNDFHRNALAEELLLAYGQHEGEHLVEEAVEVAVAGRMMVKRVMGKASFIKLQDRSGQIQVRLERDRLPEGWEENPDQLNRFAWWCFENDVNLEEAQELALKGVELAETDGQKANILDTAAEICNALGNCDEAIVLMKRALEDEPTSEYYAEQLTRFEEAVESVRADLKRLHEVTSQKLGAQHADIFTVHLLLLEDVDQQD